MAGSDLGRIFSMGEAFMVDVDVMQERWYDFITEGCTVLIYFFVGDEGGSSWW